MATKRQTAANTMYPFYGVEPDLLAENILDDHGRPDGGEVHGPGLTIQWSAPPKQPKGADVEDVIWAALQRLQFVTGTDYLDLDHATAITKLEEALQALKSRQLSTAAKRRSRPKKQHA